MTNRTTHPLDRVQKHHANPLVRSLRSMRSLHRMAGLAALFFVVVLSVTGLLLGWKEYAYWLQPTTEQGTSAELTEWLPLAEIEIRARQGLAEHLGVPLPLERTINRMDARPRRGVVKVRFDQGFWEVQVDGATGRIMSVARRHADWIETIHDGSIIGSLFKLISMNALGIILVTLALSGFWLWWGPRRIRSRREATRLPGVSR